MSIYVFAHVLNSHIYSQQLCAIKNNNKNPNAQQQKGKQKFFCLEWPLPPLIFYSKLFANASKVNKNNKQQRRRKALNENLLFNFLAFLLLLLLLLLLADFCNHKTYKQNGSVGVASDGCNDRHTSAFAFELKTNTKQKKQARQQLLPTN